MLYGYLLVYMHAHYMLMYMYVPHVLFQVLECCFSCSVIYIVVICWNHVKVNYFTKQSNRIESNMHAPSSACMEYMQFLFPPSFCIEFFHVHAYTVECIVISIFVFIIIIIITTANKQNSNTCYYYYYFL